jgi:hypothetical protein
MRVIGRSGLAHRCCAVLAGALALTLSAALVGALSAAPAARATADTTVTARALCGAGVDPYSYPEGALAACGDVYYPVQRSYALPDGGTAYVYATPGGATTFYVPRADFNPFLASASVRAAYDVPAAPATGPARASWEQAASRAHFVDPGSFIVAVPAGAAGVAKVTTEKSQWGGYNTTGKSGAFTRVTAAWREPKIGTSCKNSAEAIWGGLGDRSYLAQAGTGYNLPGVAAHQAWWYLVEPNVINDGKPYAIKGLSAKPSQTFSVLINKPKRGSASFSFLLENVSSGAISIFAKSTEHDFGPTYAAAVVEYPYTKYKAVSNFGTVTFTQVTANFRGFGADNLDKDVMVDLNSSKFPTLATTGKLTDQPMGATYSVKYGHCN